MNKKTFLIIYIFLICISCSNKDAKISNENWNEKIILKVNNFDSDIIKKEETKKKFNIF